MARLSVSKMSLKVHLIVSLVSAFAAAAPPQSSSEPVRFSRLLNQPDLLRFTSISNLGPASPVFDQQNFQNLYNVQDLQLQSQADVRASSNQNSFSSQFLHRSEHDDDSRIITEPQAGQEYVQIHQQLKQEVPDQSETDSVSRESSITNINQKPSGRKPFALLRQSAGNKLNISPVFPGSSIRRNGNNQLTILSDSRSQDEVHDATTASPLGSNTDDEYDGVTTENVRHEDDESVTTYPTTFSDKKDRMVVNVVTSIPRIVFDNTTTATEGTTLAAATTTQRPPSTPAQESSSSSSKGEDDENLVVDAFHRNGHFPDFEDSPAHLHTAESSQPARVNVRPASSGKDYEYEYIYYYYDDEDDDNSTSKKTSSDAVSKSPEVAAVSPEFSSEKLGVTKQQTNSIEVPVARTPKVYQKSEAVVPQTLESQEEPIQVTTVIPEILKAARPNSVNNRVVLKQPNMNSLLASAETPTTERHRIPTTATTTTATPTTESPRSTRIRMSKSRTEAPAVNQFTRPNEDVAAESVDSAPPRRPTYKDVPRRRNPSRRIPQQEAASTVEQQPTQPEEPRSLPAGRTRFPPRQTTQTVVEPVVTEQAVIPVQQQEIAVQQSLESSQSTQEVDIAAINDRKAKDNFARQKSINDLYALTRLHQLAINTRVPNRVPPKVVGGFVNSAEQTTRYTDDATGSSEATTLASLFPSAISAEAAVVPTEQVYQTPPVTTTTTTTTTTEASLAANDRFAAGKARNRFRQRGNRLNTADGPSSTTETASRAPASNHNRFAGRRRPFASTTAASVSDDVDNVETSSLASRPRAPARNRFAGRTRPPTSTTEANEPAVVGVEVEHVENQAEKVQPARRRPNFQARRRNQQLQQAATPQSDNVEVASQTPATIARVNSEGERRKFNFGNAARTRPNGPRPLVRGRPTSTTEATETVSTAQNPEPIVSEHVSVSESEQFQAEKPSTEPEEHAPIVSISSTTSSSVSTDTVVHKKGSAGVLGRLRSRTKSVATTTTLAPEVSIAERKPSRLSGILNRRKVIPGTSTSNPVKEEVPLSPEIEELQRKGVVIQVSSTVTESEEIGEHPELDSENSSSSTTHASILNRVKSHRKPGSIYRKAPSHSSE